MKWALVLMTLTLSACSMLDPRVMRNSAPADGQQLLHPEWGTEDGPGMSINEARFSNTDLQSLQNYLDSQGISYQVVPGGHVMVKLEQAIHFATGSARLSTSSKRWLGTLSRYFLQQQHVQIVIDGHTDSTGSVKLNNNLSQKRAESIKQELMKNQISTTAIYTRGHGEYSPACTNSTVRGKACNRRAELTLLVSNR